MYGSERATLDHDAVRVITRTWGGGEYQADLFIRDQQAPLVRLNLLDGEELRAFARGLLVVADEVERQYDHMD